MNASRLIANRFGTPDMLARGGMGEAQAVVAVKPLVSDIKQIYQANKL